MKWKLWIALTVLGTASLMSAESINEQIDKIRNAPPRERVEMMNRLKLQIATMNEEERSKTLEALRANGSMRQLRQHLESTQETGGMQYRYGAGGSPQPHQKGKQ